MLESFGFLFLFLGALAFFISAFGLVRMPDIYTRMHIGTKTTTIATILVTIGEIMIEPTWAPKLLLLTVFIFLTNPISTSVIAKASHSQDVDLTAIKHDELKKKKVIKP